MWIIGKNAHIMVIYLPQQVAYIIPWCGLCLLYMTGSPELLATGEPQQDNKPKYPHLSLYGQIKETESPLPGIEWHKNYQISSITHLIISAMNKYVFIIISLFVSQAALSQEIQNSKLKYDSNFNPYIETTVKNTEQKAITHIEFQIAYRWEHGDYSKKYEKKIVTVDLPVLSSKFISFYIPDIEYYIPKKVSIYRVRFRDGTVKYL